MHNCSNWLGLLSSKPNMSKIPMNPSVACFKAWLRSAIDLFDLLELDVPTVEAWRLDTYDDDKWIWIWTLLYEIQGANKKWYSTDFIREFQLNV